MIRNISQLLIDVDCWFFSLILLCLAVSRVKDKHKFLSVETEGVLNVQGKHDMGNMTCHQSEKASWHTAHFKQISDCLKSDITDNERTRDTSAFHKDLHVIVCFI